jgi:hypothetical protein
VANNYENHHLRHSKKYNYYTFLPSLLVHWANTNIYKYFYTPPNLPNGVFLECIYPTGQMESVISQQYLLHPVLKSEAVENPCNIICLVYFICYKSIDFSRSYQYSIYRAIYKTSRSYFVAIINLRVKIKMPL